MKTLIARLPMKFLFIWLLVHSTNCSDPTQDMSSTPFASNQNAGDWVDFLDDLYSGPCIIVPKEGSIQDAVDQAQPGESVYIEPGIYKEQITINKTGIKLIGVTLNKDDQIVIQPPSPGRNSIVVTGDSSAIEIVNIQYTRKNISAGRAPVSARKKHTSFKITREELPNNIAHYEFQVRVGNGQFDVVKIHRVVRENKPYQPARAQGSVFMLHGASLNFNAIFLRAGTDNMSAQTSAAIFMASNGIDVWGMDFAWTLVPLETTDFTFMKDWGIVRDVDHTLAAMSVARLIRGLTGQGFGRMNLLGYSYGVGVAYAAAGRETQQHPILQGVKGIVAVDQVMKYSSADETSRQSVCKAAAAIKKQMDEGVYQNNGGVVFGRFGNLATTAPGETSPLVPGLTNYQAALFVGTNTFLTGNPPAPFWHFVGGQFTEKAPTGLRYSDPTRWIYLLKSLPPYQPQLTGYESRLCICNEVDVAFDDHLGKISVPILYIGAGGAFGTMGDHSSGLTRSNDITNYTVTITENDRLIDFGHGDLFIANEAGDRVWKKLYQWLISHNNHS